MEKSNISRSEEFHVGDSLPFTQDWFTQSEIKLMLGQIEPNIWKLGKKLDLETSKSGSSFLKFLWV